jgi:ParB-like chromosome segregation protein Spo0J
MKKPEKPEQTVGMKSEQVEAFLRRQGVDFHCLDLPFGVFNVQASLSNQARVADDDPALDEEWVQFYQWRYEDGEQAPALIAYQRPGGKYVLLDGNRRLAAAMRAAKKAGVTRHTTYVVESSDPLVLERVGAGANRDLVGAPPTRATLLAQAVRMVKHGMLQSDAMKVLHLTKEQVSNAVRLAEVSELLGAHNVKRTALMTDSWLRDLMPLRRAGDDVFVEAVKTARDVGANGDQARELARAVQKQPTQDGKLKAVRQFAASDEAKASKGATKVGTINVRRAHPFPRDCFPKALREVDNLLRSAVKAALTPSTPQQRRDLRDLAAGVVAGLCHHFGFGAEVLKPRKEARRG